MSVMQKALKPALLLIFGIAWIASASSPRFDATKRSTQPNAVRNDNTERWGRLIVRNSTYVELRRGNPPQRCEINTPPEALATPNPMLNAAETLQLTVSFVVGTDGHVYSPLVLEGANEAQAQPVLEAVRHWRYRPAVCNGAPAESEAKVEFSSLPNRF